MSRERQSSKKRFRAFISYSMKDEAIVKRLHRWLETYRVPKGVQPGADLERGRRLGRFFRDDEEMGASSDIGATIRAAIEDSESIIVVCSPRAAQSEWVNAEIEHFRETGRGRKVFAVIIDGTPNSNNPKTECFPPALRKGYDNTNPKSMPLEPLGIDMRREPRTRLIARLAAGLLDVGFDALWKRHRRRAAARRWRITAAVASIFAILSAVGLTAIQNQNLERSIQLAKAARTQIDAGQLDSAVRIAIEGTYDSLISPSSALARNALAAAAYSNRLIDVYEHHQDEITALALSPNGSISAAADLKGHLILRHLDTGQEIARIGDFKAPLNKIAFSSDGNFLIAAGLEGTVGSWHAATGEPIKLFQAHHDNESTPFDNEANIVSFAISPDSQRFATIAEDGRARVWEVKTGRLVSEFVVEEWRSGFSSPIRWYGKFVTFTPDNRSIVISPASGDSILVDADTGVQTESFNFVKLNQDQYPRITSHAVSSDGRFFAAGWSDGAVRIWLLDGGGLVGVLGDPIGNVSELEKSRWQPYGHIAVGFDKRNENLISITGEGRLRRWQISTGQLISDNFARANNPATNTEKSQIVTASLEASKQKAMMIFADGVTQIWNTATGRMHSSQSLGNTEVTASILSADGTRAMAGTIGGRVYLLNIKDSVNVVKLQDRGGLPASRITMPDGTPLPIVVGALGVSGNGKRAVTGYMDGTAVVWDTLTGRSISVLTGNGGGTRSIALDRSGETVLIGAEDGTARIFDAQSGELLSELISNQWPIISVHLTGDGKHAMTGSEDGTARVWHRSGESKDSWVALIGLEEPSRAPHERNPEGVPPIQTVALSEDAKYAMTGAESGPVRVWDVTSGQEVELLFETTSVRKASAFSADGRYLVVAFSNEFSDPTETQTLASVWQKTDGGEGQIWQKTGELRGRFMPISAVRLGMDGSRAVLASKMGISIWDVGTEQIIAELPASTFNGDPAIALSEDDLSVFATWSGATNPMLGPYRLADGTDAAIHTWNVALLMFDNGATYGATPPLRETICHHTSGLIRGRLRKITNLDIEAAPSLRSQFGEDVCRTNRFTRELNRSVRNILATEGID